MTQTLNQAFRKSASSGCSALVLYATAGDPSMDRTVDFLWFCQDAGVDVVELGIPFSDPIADGPVIQASSYRAVERGICLESVSKILKIQRAKGLVIPVVYMTSVNPVYAIGVTKAAEMMRSAEVGGIIMPDLPFDEDCSIRKEISEHDIDCIQMVTPTTGKKRASAIAEKSRGFIYYVSLIGLTGKDKSSKSHLKNEVTQFKKRSDCPVCIGFGISDAKQVKEVSGFADGVIVGSAVVDSLYKHSKQSLSPKTKTFINGLVRACRR